MERKESPALFFNACYEVSCILQTNGLSWVILLMAEILHHRLDGAETLEIMG